MSNCKELEKALGKLEAKINGLNNNKIDKSAIINEAVAQANNYTDSKYNGLNVQVVNIQNKVNQCCSNNKVDANKIIQQAFDKVKDNIGNLTIPLIGFVVSQQISPVVSQITNLKQGFTTVSQQAVTAASVAAAASTTASAATTASTTAATTASKALSKAGAAFNLISGFLTTWGVLQVAERLDILETYLDRVDKDLGKLYDKTLPWLGQLQNHDYRLKNLETSSKYFNSKISELAARISSATKGDRGEQGNPGKDADIKRIVALETKIKERERVDKQALQRIEDLNKNLDQQILKIPGILIASQLFIGGITNAAASGACRTMQPGGCGSNRMKQAENNISNDLKNRIDPLGAALSGLNTSLLTPIKTTVNTINSKLGAQVPGGISGQVGNVLKRVGDLKDVVIKKFGDTWKFLQLDRVLNLLTFAAVFHNAMMLSASLKETLMETISNVLGAIGIKDYSKNPEGEIFDINSMFNSTIEAAIKNAVGAENFEGIKADFKKYNRIYQAAANMLSAVQGLSYTILSALEIVGGQTARIGNALLKSRTVLDNAFGWMNPSPNFGNRLFVALDGAEDKLSTVNEIAENTLSAQSQIANFGNIKKELDDSLKDLKPSGMGVTPSPTLTTAAATAKTESAGITATEKDFVKPD
ncbi:MAG: hypothetical protein WBB28_24950 [Crinalium sp.]